MSTVNIDVRKELADAIDMQRRRIYAFYRAKDPDQRDWNDAIRVMGHLLKEARSLTKDGIAWSRSLGPEERRDVIVAWFSSLPPNQQRVLLEELQKHQTMRAV